MDEIPVEVPAEPVYYYEVSRGECRLLYFIPAERLEQLIQEGECDPQALVDYPDGIDLPCTESQFQEFSAAYKFRPTHDPQTLMRAFYAIWTSTKDWVDGTHSGFIPANVVEDQIEQIVGLLAAEELEPKPSRQESNILKRRNYQANLEAVQQKVKLSLEDLAVEIIDQKRSIAEQSFPKIRMQKGVSIDKLFNQLNVNSEEQ
ncbi:MAG: hypothetical protein AAF802_24850 [Planctomycetota bacterium]